MLRASDPTHRVCCCPTCLACHEHSNARRTALLNNNLAWSFTRSHHRHCFCVRTPSEKPLTASASTDTERALWITQITGIVDLLKLLEEDRRRRWATGASGRKDSAAEAYRASISNGLARVLAEERAVCGKVSFNPADTRSPYDPFAVSAACTVDKRPYTVLSHIAPFFRYIRKRLFSIDEDSFLQSLQKLKGSSGDGGRSGSVFFFTTDKKYMLKSINSEEVTVVRTMLSKYIDYFKRHPHSLLPQLLGLFEVRPASSSSAAGSRSSKPMTLICTNSCFSSDLPIHETYDLKGSTVDRYVSLKRSGSGKTTDSNDSRASDESGPDPSLVRFVSCAAGRAQTFTNQCFVPRHACRWMENASSAH